MKIISTAKLKTSIKERLITSFPSVNFYFYKDINEASTELVDTEILITYGEDLTTEIVLKMQKLKWIMVISAGMDLMPFPAIKEKGILVTNAKGIHKVPMAEYTIAMMLQVARQTKTLIENEKNHLWDRTVPMMELSGKTIGVLGAGAIGTQIAKYAKVFNMKTIGFSRSGKSNDLFDEVVKIDNLEHLLVQSDFVVSVLPSTKETDGMLDEHVFKQMKDGVVFINIGRGKNIVEKDLKKALEEKKISHAVLDVFIEEPLPKDHFFWEMENVTVTPHLSGISAQYQPRAIEIFVENLQKLLKGKTEFTNVVNLDKGY